MAKLFFIGDSITAGAWDEAGGWATRLSAQLLHRTRTSTAKHKGFYCMPYNLGVSGDTVADVIRRFDQEVGARTYGDTEQDKSQIVFAVGVNDSVCLIEEKCNHATDATFEEDLMILIKKARAITDHITFNGLLPADETRTDPCPWNPLLAYRNESIERFNGIIRDVCAREGIGFINHYDEWAAMPDLADYFTDGLHPNACGHEKLAKKIGERLFDDAFTDFHTK
jgi:lysophospholipase L1-like esterase